VITTDTIIYTTLNICSMFTVVVGIDTNVDRAVSQAQTVAKIPDAAQAVRAILLHDFGKNPEGGTVEAGRVGQAGARDTLKTQALRSNLKGPAGRQATPSFGLPIATTPTVSSSQAANARQPARCSLGASHRRLS